MQIPEDSLPGAVVGMLTAEDPDNVIAATQSLRFTLADPEQKMFAINQTQLIVSHLHLLLFERMNLKI